jgi:hypothetical protein
LGNTDAGSHARSGRGRRLRKKPLAVKLGLAGRESQSRADMSRPAGADFEQVARSCDVRFGMQGTAGASSHQQAGRGRLLHRKPQAVNWALTSREPQAQVVTSRP